MLVIVYLNSSCMQSNCFNSRGMNETCENKKYALHYYITYINKIKPLYTFYKDF